MYLCVDCRSEIKRVGEAVIAGVSHGLCLPCFANRFSDVESESLPQLASDALEQLPMGAILLDADLRVVGYNAAESRMTGLTMEKVVGRKFFVEIAPCMAAEAVGRWCAERVLGATIVQKEVDWVLTLREGKRLATLSMLAGRGRVAISIALTPLELGTSSPSV